MDSYIICTSTVPTEVEDKVRGCLEASFVPYGPLIVTGSDTGPARYTQAMVYTAPDKQSPTDNKDGE